MRTTVSYHWHLRQVMAERGLFSTTALGPMLVERGVELSTPQVYRLVTGTPERLNLQVLAALCDALGCTPSDLIEPVAETVPGRRRVGTGRTRPIAPAPDGARPTRARIITDQ